MALHATISIDLLPIYFEGNYLQMLCLILFYSFVLLTSLFLNTHSLTHSIIACSRPVLSHRETVFILQMDFAIVIDKLVLPFIIAAAQQA